MFFLRCIFVCFVSIPVSSTDILKDCKKPTFGSMLAVKVNSSYKITARYLIQTSHVYNKCDDYEINHSWNRSYIIIGPVLSSYSGNYVMSSRSSAGLWTNVSFCINVKHNVHVNTKKLIVDRGDPMTLKCTFASNCNLEAIWYKTESHSLTSDDDIVNIGNYTRVVIYKREYALETYAKFTYKCKIEDTPAVKVQLIVKVHKKPEVILGNQKSLYSENLPARIKLRIRGSPIPKLACNHRKEEILSCTKHSMKKVLYDEQSQPCISQSGRYMLFSAVKQTEEVIFEIEKVKLEKDNGNISCSLVNSKGQTDFTLVINVFVKPVVELRVSKNKSKSIIDCIVKAYPSPEISWKQCKVNGTNCRYLKKNTTKKEVGYGKYKSTISLNTSALNIYKCEAKNAHGKDIKSTLPDFTVPDQNSKQNQGKSRGVLFIVFGCAAFVVLLVIVIGVSLYWREHKRNNTYKNFFLANNNYTIDPLKSLNEQMHNLSYDKDWEFPFTFLEFKEELGCGAFGKVYKAEAFGIMMLQSRDKSSYAKKQREKLNSLSTKMKLANSTEYGTTTVAVKTIKDSANLEDIRNLAGELKMIIHVGQHENIVNILGACTRYPKLYLIMEYCIHGSLLEFLHNKRGIFEPTWIKEDFASEGRFTIANLVMAAKQVINGMKFLTSRKCVHRDLAARNVLVSENYVMKVADFGMARDLFKNNNYISTTQGYLPVKWMALESILQKVYTEESDVWSFGILLWEMMTLGKSPYSLMPITQLIVNLNDGVRMGKPAGCPDELHKIMLSCWQKDPTERPSFGKLCSSIESLLAVNVIN